MPWINNISVGKKIISGFLFVSILTAVVGGLGIWYIGDMYDRSKLIYEHELLGIMHSLKAEAALVDFGRAEKNYLLSSSEELHTRYLGQHAQFKDKVIKEMEQARSLIYTPKGREMMPVLFNLMDEYWPLAQKVLDIGNSTSFTEKQAAIELSMGSARDKNNALRSRISDYVEYRRVTAEMLYKQAADDYSRSFNIFITIILISVIIAICIGLLLTRAITVPLRSGVSFAQQIAHGRMDQQLDVIQKDEIGKLADALRAMVAELKNKIEFTEGVLKGIIVPCVILDPKGKIIFTNQQLIDLMQREGTPEKFIGMLGGEFVYNDPRKKTVTDKAFEDNTIIKIDKVSIKTLKGNTVYCNIVASPIYDFTGKVIAAFTLLNDVTEIVTSQTKAEQATKEGIIQAAQQLESVVEIVTSASEELSAQIEQSSRGSEEQSKQFGEAATSMEEMNATVLEVAKNASNAANTADQAKIKAEAGAKIVSQVVLGIEDVQKQSHEMKSDMGSLGKQAEGIGQILNVISDIADQTNLLALNAAIEAARAGDAGRGFAVVADEVRKLAEKTMTATKEVGQAIRGIQDGTKKNIDNVERSGKTIEDVTRLANDSGESLKEIVKLSETTTDQVRSIATASEEQSSASEEINRNLVNVTQISSETANAMRQSAQAVSELAKQAQVLTRLIDEMKSDEGVGTTALPSSKKRLALGRA